MTKEQLKSVAENLVSIFETCNKVGTDQSTMEQCQYELNKYALEKLQEESGCCDFCNCDNNEYKKGRKDAIEAVIKIIDEEIAACRFLKMEDGYTPIEWYKGRLKEAEKIKEHLQKLKGENTND